MSDHPMAQPWSTWRPIETAHKDGMHLMLYDSDVDRVVTGFWARNLSAWICTCHFIEDGVADDTAIPSHQIHAPTHWMPIPKPPTTST